MDTTSNELGETFIEQYVLLQSQIDHLMQVFETIDLHRIDNQNYTLDGIVESQRDRLVSTNDGSSDLFDLETALAAERIEKRCTKSSSR